MIKSFIQSIKPKLAETSERVFYTKIPELDSLIGGIKKGEKTFLCCNGFISVIDIIKIFRNIAEKNQLTTLATFSESKEEDFFYALIKINNTLAIYQLNYDKLVNFLEATDVLMVIGTNKLLNALIFDKIVYIERKNNGIFEATNKISTNYFVL